MPIQHLSMILILRIKDARLSTIATPLETFSGFEMITPPLAVVLKYSWALGQFSLCLQMLYSLQKYSLGSISKNAYSTPFSMGRLNGRSWNGSKPRTWPWQPLIVVLSIKQALSAVLIIIQSLSTVPSIIPKFEPSHFNKHSQAPWERDNYLTNHCLASFMHTEN